MLSVETNMFVDICTNKGDCLQAYACYYKLSTLTPSKIARSKGDIWGSVKNKILLKMSVIHFVAFLYWHLGKKMRRNF